MYADNGCGISPLHLRNLQGIGIRTSIHRVVYRRIAFVCAVDRFEAADASTGGAAPSTNPDHILSNSSRCVRRELSARNAECRSLHNGQKYRSALAGRSSYSMPTDGPFTEAFHPFSVSTLKLTTSRLSLCSSLISFNSGCDWMQGPHPLLQKSSKIFSHGTSLK